MVSRFSVDTRAMFLVCSHQSRPKFPSVSPSYGTAESTRLTLKNEATWELNVMGDAKRWFTIRAGACKSAQSGGTSTARMRGSLVKLRAAMRASFWQTNFHAAVQPVLQACGASLDHTSVGMAMKTFLLLVTWLIHGQPPSNYQVTFGSPEACEAARLQVINDAQRIRREKYDQVLRSGLGESMAALTASGSPSVSAVCVAQ